MRLLIIDGNNLLYRTYWAIKNKNEYTDEGLITGFLLSIRKYIEKFNPEKILCTWDKKLQETDNFRKLQNEEYKGNRTHNEEIYKTTEVLDKLMSSVGIKVMYPLHLEADDIMHYISVHNNENIIVTTDKDLLQLVNEHTSVYNPIKKIIYNNNNFKNIVGNTPKEFLMIKAIVGDSSDNIKGLPGYGVKKAIKLIQNPTLITEEQLKIIENNINLMDLSRGWQVNEPGEKYIYREQFKLPWPVPNKETFENLCIENKLNYFLKNKSKISIFFNKTNTTPITFLNNFLI